jgi:hypothetical protein
MLRTLPVPLLSSGVQNGAAERSLVRARCYTLRSHPLQMRALFAAVPLSTIALCADAHLLRAPTALP